MNILEEIFISLCFNVCVCVVIKLSVVLDMFVWVLVFRNDIACSTMRIMCVKFVLFVFFLVMCVDKDVVIVYNVFVMSIIFFFMFFLLFSVVFKMWYDVVINYFVVGVFEFFMVFFVVMSVKFLCCNFLCILLMICNIKFFIVLLFFV